VPDISLPEALNTEKQSQYAQILSKTYRWIRETSRYFTYEIDVSKDYMYDFYDIWEGHRISRY
jgi:hypothetical protein